MFVGEFPFSMDHVIPSFGSPGRLHWGLDFQGVSIGKKKIQAPQLAGGKHPMVYRVSTCFNHPLGGAGFRWPIHYDVSVVLCDSRAILLSGVFSRCVALFVAGAALWTCGVVCVFATRIVRAASSGDHVQIAWQT